MLVIGFFLPFVSVLVAEGLGGMGDMGGESAVPKQDNPGWLMNIIAMIPIVGLISAIVNKKAVHMFSGFIPIAILLAWTEQI